MKAIIIAYYEALDEEVMEILEQSNVQNYTKWTKVLGKGSGSGAHMMNTIWPKGNNVLFCAMEEEVIPPLLEKLKALRADQRAEGVKVFQIPIEILT